MLVVTRQEGEEVVIGDPRNPIGVVRIASIRGDRVRIAFDFPRSVEVNRREVADSIVKQAGEPADGARLSIESAAARPEPELRPTVIGTIRPKTASGG